MGSIIIDFLGESRIFSTFHICSILSQSLLGKLYCALTDTHAAHPSPPFRRTFKCKSHNPLETFKGQKIHNAASCKVEMGRNAESFQVGNRTWYYLKRDQMWNRCFVSMDDREIGVRLPAKQEIFLLSTGPARVSVPHNLRFNAYRRTFTGVRRSKREANTT
jgi:hypothetical protein